MAEKRNLPGKGRPGPGRPPKRRLAEADATATPSPKRLQRHNPRRPSATPSKKTAETPAPSIQAEPAAEEIILPPKIADNQPLPTLSKPQTQSAVAEYQSYAESGVVAAALHRSRARWLHDCLFEKYWTKPSKKKNQPQPTFQNPPKDSMTKLGPCTMVIEPHYFEVMLYAVRRPQSQKSDQQPLQQPMVQVQYTPTKSSSPFHEYHPRRPTGQPSTATSLHQTPGPQQPRPGPQSKNPPGPVNQPQLPPAPHHPPPTQAQSTPQRPQNAPPPGKPSADPVIQLLANRAATNPDLRALMRIVADSQADPEQLRAFQAHIDEINAIIASRAPKDVASHSPQVKSEPPTQATATSAPTAGNNGRTPPLIASRNSTLGPGAAANHPPNQHQTTPGPAYPLASNKAKNLPKQPPAQNGCFRPIYSQPAAHTARMDIKGIVFEFISPAGANHGSTGDRYLFPENMILDYFPGNTTVIASFLAIKRINPPEALDEPDTKAPVGKVKGKKAKLLQAQSSSTTTVETPSKTLAPPPETKDVKNADDSVSKDLAITETPEKPADSAELSKGAKSNVKEFYQPVTLRLHANNPRTLEPLARAVKAPGEVRDHMNAVMDRMERADIEYLALRLPREHRRRGIVVVEDAGKPGVSGHATPKPKGSELESQVATPKKEDKGVDSNGEIDEELKDYYDSPSGLVPLRS